MVDDVEALLGLLAEVVHLEAAWGEDPAAAGEAFLPAALVVVAREDVVGDGLRDVVEAEAGAVGGDGVVALDEAVEHEDLEASGLLEAGLSEAPVGGVDPVVVVEADDGDVLVCIGPGVLLEDVEVFGEGVLDVVEGVALGTAVVVSPDDKDLDPLAVALLGLPCEAVELVVGELDEAGAEGAALEEVPADEDVVATDLYYGVNRLPEGLVEGPSPVLGYG